MLLSTLDILYITLTIFTAIIGTLLSIVLIRTIKVLWVAVELVDYYNKIKKLIIAYKQIPEIVKEKVKEFTQSQK